MRTPQLEKAYLATVYCIDPPGGERIALRIGQDSPQLRQALAGSFYGNAPATCRWAIITAVNPGSVCSAAAENAERMACLRATLAAEGYQCWPGENLASSGDWPPEPAFFVPGLEKTEALRLAGGFGQNAIVIGDGAGIPELVWLPRPGQAPGL